MIAVEISAVETHAATGEALGRGSAFHTPATTPVTRRWSGGVASMLTPRVIGHTTSIDVQWFLSLRLIAFHIE